jgi:hypothetical protein
MTRNERTMGEAEAERRGYERAKAQAVAWLAEIADSMAGVALDDTLSSEHRRRAESHVAALDKARHHIVRMRPEPEGECCHKTRLAGALCPVGRACPHIKPEPAP